MTISASLALLENAKLALKYLFKATVYNFSANPAVFYVPSSCTVKHLKKRYSAEVSNPLSDLIYPLEPDTDHRPEPIANGAFVPASVLVFFDDDGRKLNDDELLFPYMDEGKMMTTLTAWPTHAGKSVEEMRLEDYTNGRICPSEQKKSDDPENEYRKPLLIPTFEGLQMASLTAFPEYTGKSVEEIRLHDYMLGRILPSEQEPSDDP